MSRERINAQGEGSMFASVAEVHRAYESRRVELHASVKVRIKETTIDEKGEKTTTAKVYDTTVGRALLSEILPDGLSFDLVNRTMDKKAISRVINAMSV
jgi:DNA-directed RNA polymerase subunit beta'